MANSYAGEVVVVVVVVVVLLVLVSLVRISADCPGRRQIVRMWLRGWTFANNHGNLVYDRY